MSDQCFVKSPSGIQSMVVIMNLYSSGDAVTLSYSINMRQQHPFFYPATPMCYHWQQLSWSNHTLTIAISLPWSLRLNRERYLLVWYDQPVMVPAFALVLLRMQYWREVASLTVSQAVKERELCIKQHCWVFHSLFSFTQNSAVGYSWFRLRGTRLAAHSDDVTPIPHQSELQLAGEMQYPQAHCNFNPIFHKFTLVVKAWVVLRVLQCDNRPTERFSDC